MKTIVKPMLIGIIVILSSCENQPDVISTTNSTIAGYVQKGPFLIGSSVSVYDLDPYLTPTGRVFNTQIENNEGKFVLKEIPLSSNYVLLRADGYYFNEVKGEKSKSQITLYALSDIRDKNEIYVNLLTHLEKPRVEGLLEEGLNFHEAKKIAQREIIRIFNISDTTLNSSENLSIIKEGNDNAILLAITSILQGYRSEGELSELLAYIAADLKPDGVLDDPNLGSLLINDAIYIDSASITNNLETRYEELNAIAHVPQFGKYLNHFITTTNFEITESLIDYPETGLYGKNLLNRTDTLFAASMNNPCSLHAILPESTKLKVKISFVSTISDSNSDSTNHSAVSFRKPGWLYSVSSNHNWSITIFDTNTYTQTFTAVEDNGSCDLRLYFEKGRFRVDFYEMGSATPTRTKFIRAE